MMLRNMVEYYLRGIRADGYTAFTHSLDHTGEGRVYFGIDIHFGVLPYFMRCEVATDVTFALAFGYVRHLDGGHDTRFGCIIHILTVFF